VGTDVCKSISAKGRAPGNGLVISGCDALTFKWDLLMRQVNPIIHILPMAGHQDVVCKVHLHFISQAMPYLRYYLIPFNYCGMISFKYWGNSLLIRSGIRKLESMANALGSGFLYGGSITAM
jgi:hypothetical protein